VPHVSWRDLVASRDIPDDNSINKTHFGLVDDSDDDDDESYQYPHRDMEDDDDDDDDDDSMEAPCQQSSDIPTLQELVVMKVSFQFQKRRRSKRTATYECSGILAESDTMRSDESVSTVSKAANSNSRVRSEC
jgi:hypothetical protein